MPRITTGYGVRRQGSEREAFILVERMPWRFAVAASVAEWLCRLTCHRSCRFLCDDVYEWSEKRTEKFETPCTPEHAAAFSEWHGWGRPFFMSEDGEHVAERAYASRVWAEDWDSPEDAAYDDVR